MKNFLREPPPARPGASEEIAAAVVWLGRDSARFVIGLALVVEGGLIVY